MGGESTFNCAATPSIDWNMALRRRNDFKSLWGTDFEHFFNCKENYRFLVCKLNIEKDFDSIN